MGIGLPLPISLTKSRGINGQNEHNFRNGHKLRNKWVCGCPLPMYVVRRMYLKVVILDFCGWSTFSNPILEKKYIRDISNQCYSVCK